MRLEHGEVIIMSKNKRSTFEREMQDPEFKNAFDESYQELVLSELLIAVMERKSVRALAEEVGVSPTIIQNIRSGKQSDIKMRNFINIARACGYKLILEKDDDRFLLEEKDTKNNHQFYSHSFVII